MKHSNCGMRHVLGLIALTCAFGAAHAQGAGINQYACGPLNPPGQFGPYDYRTITSEIRHKVEDYHFTPSVETLKVGNSGALGADIDYTLRAFPNNPRALMSVARYATTKHSEMMNGARYTAECYFERAIRFMPDDPMPHLVYAIYLKDHKRTAEARAHLDEAERLRGDPSNFDFDYNLGLLYYDVGVYDKSLVAAKRAYALGAPLPALMKKLKAAGKWTE
jgi:tetratricopeptide (TPR) repeat protein